MSSEHDTLLSESALHLRSPRMAKAREWFAGDAPAPTLIERLRQEQSRNALQLPWLRGAVAVVRQVGDTVAILLGQWLGTMLAQSWFGEALEGRAFPWVASLTGTGVMLLLMSYVGLNKDDHSVLNIRETQRILRSWLLASITTLLLLYLAKIELHPIVWLASWITLLPVLLLHRDAFWHLSRWLHRHGIVETSALIYGTGPAARMLLKRLRLMPELGIHVAGFVDDDPRRLGERVDDLPILGDFTDLQALLRLTGAKRIYIALAQVPRRTVTDILAVCRARNVGFQIVPNLHDMALPHVRIEEIDGIPLLGISHATLRPWRRWMKRGVDLTFALSLLIVTGIPLLLAMSLTKATTKGPAIQKLRRVGRNGKLFYLLRLRIGPRSDVQPTRLGAVFHRMAIDSLPMLWNIVRGDMSLVGPRAAHVRDVARYDEFHRLRLNVRPGIAGLWRILPSAPKEGEDALDLDLQYIRQQSLLLDLSILLETARNVVLPRRQSA